MKHDHSFSVYFPLIIADGQLIGPINVRQDEDRRIYRIKRVKDGNFECVMEVQERVAGNFNNEIEALGITYAYEI